jgi:hypothetical protein
MCMRVHHCHCHCVRAGPNWHRRFCWVQYKSIISISFFGSLSHVVAAPMTLCPRCHTYDNGEYCAHRIHQNLFNIRRYGADVLNWPQRKGRKLPHTSCNDERMLDFMKMLTSSVSTDCGVDTAQAALARTLCIWTPSLLTLTIALVMQGSHQREQSLKSTPFCLNQSSL